MKYLNIILILFLFLFACENPVETQIKIVKVEVEIYRGVDSLQYLGYYSWRGEFPWVNYEYGILLFMAATNNGNKDWYGYPEIDIHTSDTLLTKFTNETLIGHGRGILTTHVIASPDGIVPIDTVFFIPPDEIRESLTFAPIEYTDLKKYYYILRSFEDRR